MIALAGDHGGFALKQEIISVLNELNLEFQDFGSYDPERTDYAPYAYKAAMAVIDGSCDKGIIICGTGVGISIAANKVKGIRCVVCSEPFSAIMSRKHNDTNMLALGGRVIGPELARMIVECWLTTEFESGGRHQRRVEQIREIENGEMKI